MQYEYVNMQGFRRKRSWPIWIYYPDIHLERL